MGEETVDHGSTSGDHREPDMRNPEGHYTVSEAAKVLSISERRVRQLAQDGRIQSVRTEGGWQLSRRSVYDFRAQKLERTAPRAARERAPEIPEWVERIATLQRELGRLEGTAELTKWAESGLRFERDRLNEDLERARARVDRLEHERAELLLSVVRIMQEHRRVRAEALRLRKELEADRGRGFFRRLLGRS
jgi:excisionase family DNA binding protein